MEPGDGVRRTLLANERTFLAWQRTGLTLLTVALAAARVVPELVGAAHVWPYVVVGVGFAAYGIVCMAYGERRRRSVDRAVRAGTFEEPDGRMTLGLAVAGGVLGLAIIAIVLIEP